MSIKTFVDAVGTILANEDELELILDPGFQKQMIELMKEANANCDLAESVLKERIPEEKLVKFILMLQKMSVSYVAGNGKGSSLVICDMCGELQSYTHTVILATIGALIREEIL